MTTIREAIGYAGPGHNTDIRRIPAIRRLFPRAYGAVLMACSKKQTQLLFLIWQDRFIVPDRLKSVLEALVDEGQVPLLLDRYSKMAEYTIEHRYALIPA